MPIYGSYHSRQHRPKFQLYNFLVSKTALDLSYEELKKYYPREAIRRRQVIEKEELSKRRHRAMLTARKAADLLRREFDAKEVFVFGSLARRGYFTFWSDIDIAARGIQPSRFFEAVGVITGISSEFKLNLVDLETCSGSFRETVKTEGKSI
jgi:predicted nucleotidyltransferase